MKTESIRYRLSAGILVLLLILGGCGLKDDLYIPTDEETDETAAAEQDTEEELQSESSTDSVP